MADYGYRLFAVELHEGLKHTPVPLTAAQTAAPDKKSPPGPVVDYRDQAHSDIQAHLGNVTFNSGTGSEDDDGVVNNTDNLVSLRFQGSSRGLNSVRIHLRSGPMNADGWSIDPKGKKPDQPLAGRSTIYDYRATLVAQPGQLRGILGVEVRGRSCPVAPLQRALKSASTVPWRLKVLSNVAARAAVLSFIDKGRMDKAQFDMWSFDADGQRDRRLVSMSVALDDGKKARERVRGWAETFFESGKRDKGKAPEEAQALAKELLSAKVDIDFNDAAVLVSSDGVSRTLAPASDFRRFTYALGKAAVADDFFFTQVEQTAESLLPLVQGLDDE